VDAMTGARLWRPWLRTRRRGLLLSAAIVIGVLALVVAALIHWELGRECVRWSTRIDVSESGKVRWTRVCAESQPRQYGEEPPFDPLGTKAK
jgi:hypothetical protein